jgi:hypothetical protein
MDKLKKILRAGMKALGIVSIVVIFSLFSSLIALNLMLGCETWDRSLWTKHNSCITFYEMLGVN